MINCVFENGSKALLRHACVDTLVIKEDKVLLVHRAPNLLERGNWGIVGGYIERDETVQQAAEREILEETGYRVSNMKLLTIRDNPDRPGEDRQNIVFVFFCEAGDKKGQPDLESIAQKWFSFDNLPKQDEMAFDHYDNIQLYLKYRKENLVIPILNF